MSDTSPDKKIAVLAFHGMGGHQPLATLTDATQVVINSYFLNKNGQFTKPFTKHEATAHSLFLPTDNGKTKISYISLTPPENTTGQTIDIYECYYSPIPKGKLKILEVVKFFFSAGWNSLGNTEFKRRVFDKEESYTPEKHSHLALLTVILGILSLIIINTVFIGQFAFVQDILLNWNKPASQLQSKLVQIMGFNASYLAALGYFIAADNKRSYKKAYKHENPTKLNDPPTDQVSKPYKPNWLYKLAVATPMILFASLLNLLPLNWPEETYKLFWVPLCFGRFIGLLVAFYIVIRLLTRSREQVSVRFKVTAWVVLIVYLVMFWVNYQTLGTNLASYNPFFNYQILNLDLILSGLTFLAGSAFAQYFILDFAGDVVSYIQGAGPSPFNPIRTEVQSRAKTMIDLLLDQGYDIAIYAHSLGSIVAYDAVNQCELDRAPAFEDAPQIRSLVTLGCPLDKVTYIFKTEDPTKGNLRDLLTASLQPLLQKHVRQRLKWINVYSKTDIVAGKLDYFDPPMQSQSKQPHELYGQAGPVLNLEDSFNTAPIASHSIYHLYPAMPYAMGAAIQHIIKLPPDALPTVLDQSQNVRITISQVKVKDEPSQAQNNDIQN